MTDYVRCATCGKRCSNDANVDMLVVRAWTQCPECIEAEDAANQRPPGPEPTQAEMAEGHLFEISVRSWGVSRVVGDPTYAQADWTLPPHPVYVRAFSLPEALTKAAALPLATWFPGEDNAEERPPTVGDRVRLWIGPPKRGGWQHGTVTAIDENGLRPGIRVRFDQPVKGLPDCYATHEEVERL